MRTFKLVGEVQPNSDGLFVLKTVGFGARGAKFEDLHVLEFPTEALRKEAEKAKHLKVLGTFENRENSDTFLLARKVEKAAKNDLGVNMAMIDGVAINYDFFPPAEGKRQFGNLVVNIDGTFVNCVAFRGKASFLQAKASNPGTEVELSGRCRRGTFYDSSGNERSSVDVIINAVKVRQASAANDHMQEMMEAAMAFESGEDAPKAKAV